MPDGALSEKVAGSLAGGGGGLRGLEGSGGEASGTAVVPPGNPWGRDTTPGARADPSGGLGGVVYERGTPEDRGTGPPQGGTGLPLDDDFGGKTLNPTP